MALQCTDFETVYKVRHHGTQLSGGFYISEKQFKEGEPHKLLYFLRKSKIKTFCDFPFPGLNETVTLDSIIEGPMLTLPELAEEKKKNYKEETFKRFIPPDEFPTHFEDIKLATYGTRKHEFERFIREQHIKQNNFYWLKAEMENVGRKALGNLKKFPEVPGKHSQYRIIDGNAIELVYADNPYYCPAISLHIFKTGEFPQNKPKEIIQMLGLNMLEELFEDDHLREMAVENRTQQGLVYNWPPEHEELTLIDRSKNVIL